MEAATERACRTIGYENAGTFEFLLGADGTFHFMELNARLQVEHPVSELVTGVDIVREQLRIAAGERLSLTGRAPRRGHAARDPAERRGPARGFAPAPGRSSAFRPPLGPGIRIDTHLEEGAAISPYYDSLIAKLVVWAEDRPAAIARCIRALAGDRARRRSDHPRLALDILRSPEFAGGDYSTSFLEEMEGRCRRSGRRMSRDGHVIRGPHGSIRIEGDALAGSSSRPRNGRRGARRRPRRGLDVVVADGAARVELELAARYGAVLPRSPARFRRASPPRCTTRPVSRWRRWTSRSRSSTAMSTGRRQARRTALFLLYQWDLTGQPLTALYEGEPDAFALDLAEAVSARAEELDRRITASAEAGPPIVWVRSSGTSCGSGSTSWRRRACRRRWR